MKNISIYIITILLINIGFNSEIFAQSKVKRNHKIPREKIEQMIHKEYGPKVEIDTNEVYSIQGDFNADGKLDVAVIVHPDEARYELTNYKIKYIDTNPNSSSVGLLLDPVEGMGKSCVGIAIVHGGIGGWDKEILDKYIVYSCYMSFKLIPKGTKLRRGNASEGRTPKPKGDSIFLQHETRGTGILYWNGKTYLSFYQDKGD
ncbi:MAG: hypothetical protein HY819_23355 [Acidobacteria bacterium]|nr:hypothetical protein [Acidobacteriota bacterium]